MPMMRVCIRNERQDAVREVMALVTQKLRWIGLLLTG